MKKLESSEYKELMKEHIYATVEYMFNNNQEFGIACETSNVSFEPNLPKDLKESLPEVTLFMLANYSFETANIDTQYISFEAGFGADNFGSLVHIPLLAIKQLFVDEYPVLINVSAVNLMNSKETEKEKEPIDSMAALLNNPENAKLLKRK
jgi:hypothetical protein